ncbi:tRNA lysidine(34) synthetase TilS [Pseudalkalibacillus caeni]|uniref:tRNA(Ile)-lysidine synthase n=1 Tax=Exobacillus caeni TaxID=2574798 RepID=A0A5R9EVA3_9BACL|nr:tRNA lysidine(34) synthetase TilS [Pseudalkalibacillus caeni]TLS34987.1 tRNA lysidine(34) synthetase TilS [Pseudalkalibacillus caeni]
MQSVYQFIKKHHLLEQNSVVIAGVSGGPDSMALLHFLLSNRERWQLKVIAAHVDHMFRGKESEEDFEYVKQYCSENDVPFEGIQIDVTEYKKKHGLSSQVAARDCRYRFFQQVMEKYNADVLALAHHGDDQIETMLMREVHGGYGKGLAGMAVKRPFANGYIIRPFLAVTKKEIEEYCIKQGLHPRLDPSNETDTYVRNRFRHQVIPFLKKENPNVHLRFQQQSEWKRQDEAYLEEIARSHYNEVVIQQGDKSVTFDRKRLQSMAIPLQRRLIHLILNYLYIHNPSYISSIHIEDLLRLLDAEHPSGMLSFPLGLKVIRSYNSCTLSFETNKGDQTYTYRLDVPGVVHFSQGKLKANITSTYPEQVTENDFVGKLSDVRVPLTVRTRKPGDRIQLKGMKGTKKVKDIFIDKKIDRRDRSTWPVVEDASGKVIWVVGLKRSAAADAARGNKEFIHLSFEKTIDHI